MNEVQTTEALQFRVRNGLTVHRKTLLKRQDGQRTISEVRTESYGEAFGRPSIELRPDEVIRYAHALEPADDASRAALEALHFRPPVREAEIPYEARIAQQVATATVQALIAAGMLKTAR